ncbi:MAG: SPOR domain-containing protein [Balneolaceae bacterium]
MTIHKEELIRLLTEKTEMSPEDIEQQLDELRERILDASNRGKALEIKGFGLFYFDESGKLAFRPADQLDNEINFNYAGMEPVEIDPSRTSALNDSEQDDTTPREEQAEEFAEADEPEDEDDIFGISKTLSAAEEAGTEPFGKLFGKDTDEPESTDEPDSEPKKQDKPKKAGTAPAAAKKGTQKKAAAPRKKTRDPMNTIIVVVIAAVLVFVGYFVITELTAPPQQNGSEMSQQVEEPDNPPATAEQDITESGEPEELTEVEPTDGDPSSASENSEAEKDEDPAEAEPENDRFGLYGELSETDGRVYTIVVHSLRQSSVAERTADELRNEGFRTSIRERTVDGQTVYRVGIGQFPDVETAQQEAATLPDPFKNQHFIQRLQ